MLFPPDPDSLVEKLRLVHLQCYIWVNALKATLNIEFYGLKVKRNYNGVLMWFSGNQLPLSMENGIETDKNKRFHK